MDVKVIQEELSHLANAETAVILQRFFKTGKGQYGEGDTFRGIKVPAIRKLLKKYSDISILETVKLLHSFFHEDRLLALLILVDKFRKGEESLKKRIYDAYLKNIKFVNNWDLIDLSAEHIIGPYLMGKDKKLLTKLANSNILWERRIAVLSTFHFIKSGKFDQTFIIAKILLKDKEDLIHKAVGWMLREIGKRDLIAEEKFLNKHYMKMPRTMLRYAIEKFPETKRKAYLSGKVI
jgi:3-methyladenine DNA glycosylase AlkD